MTTEATEPVGLDLAEQPVLLESIPNDAIAKLFREKGFKTWADVADCPPAQLLAMKGIGNIGFHWIRNEVCRRAGVRPYTDTGVAVVPRTRRDGVATRNLPSVTGRAGVYFIRCGPFVKIGCAKNVRQRFRAIQQVIPFQLELVGIIETEVGALRELEAQYHERFQSAHQVNEWFRLEGELDIFCLRLMRGESQS